MNATNSCKVGILVNIIDEEAALDEVVEWIEALRLSSDESRIGKRSRRGHLALSWEGFEECNKSVNGTAANLH